MRNTVWSEPTGKADIFSVRYYDPETGKAQRVTVFSKRERDIKEAEIKLMLLNWRKGAGNPDAIPSVVFESYIDSLAETHRAETISLKRGAVTPFLIRVRRMGAITDETIRDWKTGMVQKYANDTVGLRLRELRAFLNWCIKKKYITENPMQDVTIPPSVFVGRKLEDGEVQRMYAICPAVFRPFFLLALDTGARRGELLGIRWSEVDFARQYWAIPAERCKTNHERAIPLSERVLEALYALPRTSTNIFDGWTEFKIKYHWKRLLETAGIKGRVRLHDMRHTFASNFDGDAYQLKQIAGWKSDVMVEKYKHTTVSALRPAMMRSGVKLGVDLVRIEPKED